MKRTLITLLAGAALIASTGAPTFATAQRSGIPDIFQSINDRQAELDARIDAGVRDRSLTAAEAAQLRAEFTQLAGVESQYRRSPPGITPQERTDLNNRFDRLEAAYRNLVNNGRYSDGQRQYDNLFDYMLGLSR